MPLNYDGRNVDSIDKKRIKNPKSFGPVYKLYYGDGIHMTRKGFVEFEQDDGSILHLNSSDNLYNGDMIKVGYASMIDGNPSFVVAGD